MITTILYTLLMVGITFSVGFAVALLIKIVTYLLTLTQDHSVVEIITTWRSYSTIELIKHLRLRILSQSNENKYEIFEYASSHNVAEKNNNQLPPKIFDYVTSHNSVKKNRKLPEIFDYTVSRNNQ